MPRWLPWRGLCSRDLGRALGCSRSHRGPSAGTKAGRAAPNSGRLMLGRGRLVGKPGLGVGVGGGGRGGHSCSAGWASRAPRARGCAVSGGDTEQWDPDPRSSAGSLAVGNSPMGNGPGGGAGPRLWPLPVRGEGVKGREHQAPTEVEGEGLEAGSLVLSGQGPPLLSPSSSPPPPPPAGSGHRCGGHGLSPPCWLLSVRPRGVVLRGRERDAPSSHPGGREGWGAPRAPSCPPGCRVAGGPPAPGGPPAHSHVRAAAGSEAAAP